MENNHIREILFKLYNTTNNIVLLSEQVYIVLMLSNIIKLVYIMISINFATLTIEIFEFCY